ncbi:flagellar filament capping protein FliD [Paenibacillus tianjinensis]|uniref:Flagellar hook-associated protein 2 n=1 Tax=Paenibacillus tianjinensis TaxID=2810347 RepID=A0ABX7LBH6_9BACL|nr:flagellar filament capping protein FliD [Paenibacillus tianjinensis]QSF44733.1 flagellar filament capping protein FliD [Paenibacillus tianjinensis]
MATLRVSGIASGIDVDSIVKNMMTAKRVPLDKLSQQKQIMEWQRDNYREINSKLVDFKSNKLTAYNKSTAMNTQTAVVSGDTAALKAVATAEANGISMDITVTQLAQPVTAITAGATMSQSGSTRLTSSSTLADLQKLNTGAAQASNYTITLNDVSISLSSDLSISAAISKINSTSGTDVTAKFDEVTGKLSFASKTYSDKGKVSFGSGDTFQKLFGGVNSTLTYKPATIKVAGENGTSTDMSFASNSFKLNGVQLTLLSKSTSSSVVTTTTDATTALDTIKNFVSDYNSLLSTLNTKVNEERYSDYTPLTDEQREAMSDSQIETWETKAKSGLLKNDEILKSTLTAMRSAITEKLGQLSNYGITTGQYYENGKLYIDEDKLKQSISDDPQSVIKTFQGGSGSSVTSLFDKLSTTMTTAVEKLSTKAGTSKYSADLTAAFKYDSVMGKALADYTTRISDLQDKLDDYEDNLYKRFTAMETAISQYNSQSSSLASYMSS